MELNFAGPVTRCIAVEEASQVGQARREAQFMANSLGFDETDAGRAALVATELATNILKHGHGGVLQLSIVPGRGTQGLELCAIDHGPGFDLADCVRDGFSTTSTQGIGLGAIARQAQVLDMHADARGAVVVARFYPRNTLAPDLPIGAVRNAMRNETACGDAWQVAVHGRRISLALIDGLGHGGPAAEAAEAGTAAFARDPFAEPTLLMGQLHVAMTGTRGGAAAIAHYDAGSGSVRFAGIGNIAASLVDAAGSRGLASHPGIVGVQFRRAQAFDFADATGKLLVLHSDGLQSRWSLREYPGLVQRHPAVVAAVLQRDFTRGRDDTTVVAIALGGPT